LTVGDGPVNRVPIGRVTLAGTTRREPRHASSSGQVKITDLNYKPMDNKQYISCECGAELLAVEYDSEDYTFMLTQFRYSAPYYSVKRRLKFLFTGELECNEIILSRDNARRLADLLFAPDIDVASKTTPPIVNKP
jgi:hypothetical protein